MIIYLLKVTVCSGVMLLFYRLVLEREKTFRFNRFYLLGSLLLSVALPLIPIEVSTEQSYFSPPPVALKMAEQGIPAKFTVALTPEPTLPEETVWPWVLGAIYTLVSGVLLMRMIRNLYQIFRRIRQHEVVQDKGLKFVLLENCPLPHSFLNHVFVDRTTYLPGRLEPEILAHERAHVQQWHSLDIIVVEFLKSIFWINPLLGYYRQLIAQNHEYLADEAVLQKFRNIPSYQLLLLQKSFGPAHQPLTSSFNFSFTKKRFIMMNKHSSRFRALIAQVAVLPLLALALFAFSDLTLAQIAPPPPPVEKIVSTDIVKEYNALVEKYVDKPKPSFLIEPTKEDGDRLEELLDAMTKEQRVSLDYTIHKIKPLPRITPTYDDFEKYKDPHVYGVWIDDKKVSNSELNKYKPTEFSQVFISKVYPNAQPEKGYKYKYQLNLMTTPYYEAYRKQTLESDKRYTIMKKIRYKK